MHNDIWVIVYDSGIFSHLWQNSCIQDKLWTKNSTLVLCHHNPLRSLHIEKSIWVFSNSVWGRQRCQKYLSTIYYFFYLLICIGFNFICSKFEFFSPLFNYFWLDFWHCVDWGDWFTCCCGWLRNYTWFRFKFTKILNWFTCYNCCRLNEI